MTARARHALPVVLTLTTGAVEAVTFRRLGKVFSSVITGNLALLGVSAGPARCEAGADGAGLLRACHRPGVPEPFRRLGCTGSPDREPDRDTVLAPGELITAVELPPPPAGPSVYRKVRERASFEFALVSVAGVRVPGPVAGRAGGYGRDAHRARAGPAQRAGAVLDARAGGVPWDVRAGAGYGRARDRVRPRPLSHCGSGTSRTSAG